ncbi:MAG: methyltransferase domain-containing protein [Deltaproteobacteria bacterium]|nr:methyltransferase domain-containing protein [Deltaproteobacteria bacterium]
MEPFRHHVFVCTKNKPNGIPCCSTVGAEAIVEGLKKELTANELTETVQVTTCGCLGLCEKGPNMIIYPEGTWYTNLQPDNIPQIVKGHILDGKPVSELALANTDTAREEIVAHDRKVSGMKAIMKQAGVIPDQLNQYLRSFMESRLVLSAIELDLFTAIGNGATAIEISAEQKTDPRATEAILNALVAIELLVKEGDVFKNSVITADYLVQGATHDSITAILHPAKLWHSWSTLTDCVKAGTAVKTGRGDRDEDQTRAFIAAMHKNASFRGKMTVQQLDLDGVQHVLDLGGGSGAYTIAFLQHKLALKATLLDVPEVIPLSKTYIAEAGLSDRVTFVSGDMIADPLGEGYDMAWISAICHMWGPEENRDLIKRVYEALNPGGQIIIQDFVLEDHKTAPRFGAVFALNMLVNTQSGSSYSMAEYQTWMDQAGFKNILIKPMPGPTDLVTGVK